ncbi:phosphoribosyl-ATP pyrophosphohydrolase [Candidatus Carsonella ruddii]|uniref:Phosphoribosyl-ATP pyrophosphohydrolase n=1 Tax=Candidatus Carsonella ruddii CE isolate Thao2000 TaxID=1202536 RepID=J7GSQ8_CARRU|nr:phosphoribosyl-ATP pyrophosphohydrolase [Candidatus Carsonella ruddii]AFP83499.1 phosphoribosyl-ATP pyrophosphohydrolase [Candidatus Carsonella ruddii CE isolate Thao2000]
MLKIIFNIIKKKLINVRFSYSNLLLKDYNFIFKKIIEEFFELYNIYEKYKNKKNCYNRYFLIKELCDIIYHLTIFIIFNKITLKEINKEFFRRKLISGIKEKNNR